jgi:hypothetical protein
MTETAIKSYEREAARLFQRGVAEARGGQRRVAAGLLARVVQLDPRHEMGWLWLSGVLDEPGEIAFCLRSALTVNPHNQRAREGLAWLEQRGKIAAQPTPAAIAEPQPAEQEHAEERRARHEGESWWVNWRRSRRDMGRARLIFWSVPILLLLLTLGLHQALQDAIDRNITLVQAAMRPTVAPTAQPQRPALLQAELPAVYDSRALAYLSALDGARASLRDAVQAYRASTMQPGGSSLTHAAAARKLREQIDAAYATIDAIEPPPALAQSHANYLAGLDLERQALEDMLGFYGSFQVQFANRAALRMVDASRLIERARALFATQETQATLPAMPAQTAR